MRKIVYNREYIGALSWVVGTVNAAEASQATSFSEWKIPRSKINVAYLEKKTRCKYLQQKYNLRVYNGTLHPLLFEHLREQRQSINTISVWCLFLECQSSPSRLPDLDLKCADDFVIVTLLWLFIGACKTYSSIFIPPRNSHLLVKMISKSFDFCYAPHQSFFHFNLFVPILFIFSLKIKIEV